MPAQLPHGIVPFDGPLADLSGTVLAVRTVTCAGCCEPLEVVIVITDRNELAVLSADEAEHARVH